MSTRINVINLSQLFTAYKQLNCFYDNCECSARLQTILAAGDRKEAVL